MKCKNCRNLVKRIDDDGTLYDFCGIWRYLHSAAPNGSWCGDQRQLSAANGTLN